MGKRDCGLCMFDSWEEKKRAQCCHCEYSAHYGEDTKGVTECSEFRPHVYKGTAMKDDLMAVTRGTMGIMPFYAMPGSKTGPFLCINFKDNTQMAEWRDAHFRLFAAYMDMAQADGDFEEECNAGS